MKIRILLFSCIIALASGCAGNKLSQQPVPEYVPAAPYAVFSEGMIGNITPEGNEI